jgi:putative transposase
MLFAIMAATLTNLLYHFVFSTKDRRPLIDEHVEERLHAYIGGIIRLNDGLALDVGGVCDHVHVFVRLKANASLSNIVRLVKAGSSKWMHEEIQQKSFSWQSGYGAFTVSESQFERVRNYVRNQKDHHLKHSFEDELKLLVEKNRIAYDSKYLVD